MKLEDASHAPYRVVTYRYMTYEELAAALGSTPMQARELTLQCGWKLHADRTGRPRVSVPEAFVTSELVRVSLAIRCEAKVEPRPVRQRVEETSAA